jgi:hypothetical protein
VRPFACTEALSQGTCIVEQNMSCYVNICVIYYLHIKEPKPFYTMNFRLQIVKDLFLYYFKFFFISKYACHIFYIQSANLKVGADIMYIKLNL